MRELGCWCGAMGEGEDFDDGLVSEDVWVGCLRWCWMWLVMNYVVGCGVRYENGIRVGSDELFV